MTTSTTIPAAPAARTSALLAQRIPLDLTEVRQRTPHLEPVEGRVTVYRQHNCQRRHRTVNTFMKCAIPRAAWVLGDGPYACIAWCRVPTVTLFDTLDDAVKARAWIDATACGGRCQRRHQVVRVEVGS
jgi:hypothetical protein